MEKYFLDISKLNKDEINELILNSEYKIYNEEDLFKKNKKIYLCLSTHQVGTFFYVEDKRSIKGRKELNFNEFLNFYK